MHVQNDIIILDLKDNVAILKMPANKGQTITLKSKSIHNVIKVKEKIPFNFKIAIKDIKKGDNILKYGESIGKATLDINKGEMIHIHNIEGLRGRSTTDRV